MSTKMTDHPLLLNGEMVRATLDGRKTQTRRLVVPQPTWVDGKFRWQKSNAVFRHGPNEEYLKLALPEHNPLGVPGDLLYVRETWWAVEVDKVGVQYCVFDDEFEIEDLGGQYPAPDNLRLLDRQDWRYGRHPNIHLPKKHCRLWRKVKSVRVERVQEITQHDAIAEGVQLDEHDMTCMGDCANRHCDKINDRTLCDIYHTDEDCPETEAFGMLWDSIYAKRGYGWEMNPYVWVTEFERYDK